MPRRSRSREPSGAMKSVKKLWQKLQAFVATDEPEHLRRGRLGERAAKVFLQKQGMKFLVANFRSSRGEIDLIFRAGSTVGEVATDNGTDSLVFVEVKTRSSELWTRPAAAVDTRKKRLLSATAMDYVRLLKDPRVKLRFDIVEVLLADGAVCEIRHLPNTFTLAKPFRHG